MHLNSALLQNQSQAILAAGSTFTLSCHGNSSIRWSTTAFRLLYRDKLPNPLMVEKSDPRHTGTYRCESTNHSLGHLHTWIHLYVKDPSDPSSVFVTPRSAPQVKEGQDFLFKCLLTDPSLSNLTFRLDGHTGGRGHGLPKGMNVTFDPQRGALIQNLRVSFRGRYVCSGWRDGREFTSKPVDLLVLPRLRSPPSLSVSQVEFIRLQGEKFEVTCLTSNPSHFYNITWTHPHIEALNISISRCYSNGRLFMNSTLSVAAVSHAHSGLYTCTAINEAGVAMATTRLQVADGPYLVIYLQPREHANAKFNTRTMEDKAELVTNITTSTVAVHGEVFANVSKGRIEVKGNDYANISGSSKVEVYEGQDVTLTFVMETYPPIIYHRWTTPTDLNSSYTAYEESYTTNGYRAEASILLRRVRQEDGGLYCLHFSSSYFSGSQEVNIQIYRKNPPPHTHTIL
ncbi:hypothetical protein LDENG_00249290 [Lucifuga dentata]|nr:hypothetical protein LDENG_00249290 [Lucifuga dentata]